MNSSCFERCPAIERFEIPQSITAVGQGILTGNSLISHLDIPRGVEIISFGAFDNTGIRTVTMSPVTPPSVTTVIGQWYGFPAELEKIKVPAGSAVQYKTADGWRSFAGIVEESQ